MEIVRMRSAREDPFMQGLIDDFPFFIPASFRALEDGLAGLH
jgi:hypothetical protein